MAPGNGLVASGLATRALCEHSTMQAARPTQRQLDAHAPRQVTTRALADAGDVAAMSSPPPRGPPPSARQLRHHHPHLPERMRLVWRRAREDASYHAPPPSLGNDTRHTRWPRGGQLPRRHRCGRAATWHHCRERAADVSCAGATGGKGAEGSEAAVARGRGAEEDGHVAPHARLTRRIESKGEEVIFNEDSVVSLQTSITNCGGGARQCPALAPGPVVLGPLRTCS